MLAKRIIPTVLTKGSTMVKGVGFAADRVIGATLQAMKTHGRRGVDELVLFDVAATKEGRGPDLELVRELSQELFTPLTVGGGVKSLQDIDDLLRAGADKVAIGAAARIGDEDFIRAAAERFGSQALVGVIDDDYEPCDISVAEAQWMQAIGFGELIVQSVPADGTMRGYDIELIKAIAGAVDVPVIASGGCSGPEDMHQALLAGADGVAAGALFAFTDETPASCAKYLKGKGWNIRESC